MLALLPCLVAVVLVYLFMWLSVLAVDEGLDSHEAGLAVVAARNPFREQGPPRTWQNSSCCATRYRPRTENEEAPRRLASPREHAVSTSLSHVQPLRGCALAKLSAENSTT
ncbi:hypothetical protein B0H10DRAFT_1994925, partial [Mycena sp. CBHHK59/15]